MRIIAGIAKGRRLRSVRGVALRPTSDRMRESLFSILGRRVDGARFLDLYAGAGSVGLEALSRGAAEAVFVESHRPTARLIKENAAVCGLQECARVLAMPVEAALARLVRRGEQFELVFVDPPYGTGGARAALEELARRPQLLADDGLVICQHSRREELPELIQTFARMRRVRFGETTIDIYSAFQSAGERPSCQRAHA